MIYVCSKSIGPTFVDELEARGGLIGEHFSWWVPAPDGSPAQIEFFDDTPQEVIDNVLEVYAEHEPLTVPVKTQA